MNFYFVFQFRLLAQTIDKTELNLTIFGLIGINRRLIMTTISLWATFTLLMYQLNGDDNTLNFEPIIRINSTKV